MDGNCSLPSFMDNIQEPILVIGPDYRVLDLNQYARRSHLGDAPHQGALTCHVLTHNSSTPCRCEDHPCPLKEVFATGKAVTVYHTHCRKDGQDSFFEILGSPVFDEEGRVIAMVEASRDLSRFKNIEESKARLDAWRRQQEQVQAFTALSMNVLQEINGQLVRVLGNAESLQRHLPREGEGVSLLREIIESAETAATTLKQVTPYHILEKNRKEAISLTEMASYALKNKANFIPGEATIDTHFGADLWDVRGARHQVYQVLSHLLRTALALVAEGGRLTLTTENVTICDGWRCPSGWDHPAGRYGAFKLTFQDTVLQRDAIHDRTDHDLVSRTRERLDVLTVSRLVQANSGCIRVQQADGGRRLEAQLLLPRHVHTAPRNGAPTQQPTALPLKTILVVEPEGEMARFLEMAEAAGSYRVLTARDPETAMTVFLENGHDIDLAVLEFESDLLAWQKLVLDMKTVNQDLTVFVTSTYSPEASLSEIGPYPPEEFFRKPFSFEDLFQKVREFATT